jgi:hypothetical protein
MNESTLKVDGPKGGEPLPIVGEPPKPPSALDSSTTTEKPIIQSLITPLDNMINACITIEKTMDEMGIRALPKDPVIIPKISSLTGEQAPAPRQRVQFSGEPPVLAPSRPPASAAPPFRSSAPAPAPASVPSSNSKTAVQSKPYEVGDKVIVKRSDRSEAIATISNYDTNKKLYDVSIDGTTLTKKVINSEIRPIINPPNSSEAYNSLENTKTAVGSAFKNIGNLAGSTLGLTKDLTKAAISGTGAAFSGTGALFSKGSEMLDVPGQKAEELGKYISKSLPKRFTKKAGGAKTHRVYKKDTKKKKSNK